MARRAGRIARRLALCLVAVSWLAGGVDGAALAQDRASLETQDRTALLVTQMIARVRSVDSPEIRVAYAQSLGMVIRYLSAEGKLETIDDSHIDDLAELLEDESDALRGVVAGALGHLGPRAARAVPALEEALRKVEAMRQALPILPQADSAYTIKQALRKITAE
ncbi:MAG TPA: hypothetical protein EYH07_17975 [Kiloniellaceae bacterium]|nr:hypothetical protein [Kiloniellaceae bacterium]HIP80333.1 hypothetical protein [Kiloniellaceae bacterium]